MRDNPIHTDPDEAVRTRLAKLANIPEDTSSLERRLQDAMADNPLVRPQWRFSQAFRPLAAVAAAVVVIVTVGLALISLGNTPAMAAPNDLARLHIETNKVGAMTTPITSIEQANRVLAGQWSDLPQLPASASRQLHACCIHDFMDQKVACLILRDGQTPLTLVLGKAREFRPSEGRIVERDGRKFTLNEVNGVRMVMTQQSGSFVCLMGDVSTDRLLDLAAGLRF